MSKRSSVWDAGMGAAKWLPLLLGSMFLVEASHAQTSGVAPLMSGDCTASTAGVMTCTKTNGVALAPSATTDTTNAANIGSGTLPVARTPAFTGDVTKAAGSGATTLANSGVTAGTMSFVTHTVDAKGRVTAQSGVQQAISGVNVSGDSYLKGDQGPTDPSQSHVAMLQRDTPAPVFNYAVGGTNAAQAAVSDAINNVYSSTLPTVNLFNDGNNDYTQDTCGKATSSNCITNFLQTMRWRIAWGSLSKNNWIMASTASYTGSVAADATVPITGFSGANGTAVKCNTGTCTFTFVVPATNNGNIGIAQVSTNGSGATYTVTAAGALLTNPVTGTTTFNAAPPQAFVSVTSAPQATAFVNAAWAGNSTSVVVTATAGTIIMGVYYVPATLPVNTNPTFVENSGAAYDLVPGPYSAAIASLVTAEAATGKPVYLVDVRTALSSTTGAGVSTTDVPPSYVGSRSPNHPGNTGQAAEYAALKTAIAASGFLFSAPGAGGAYTANYNAVGGPPLNLAIGVTGTPANSNLWHNVNRNNTSGAGLAVGTTGSGYYGMRYTGVNVTFPDGATNAPALYLAAPAGVAGICFGDSAFPVPNPGACFFPNNGQFQFKSVNAYGGVNSNLYATAVGAAITAQSTVAPAAGVVHVTASTAAIATITPPAGCTATGYACTVTLIPDVAFTTATGGNVALASSAVQYRPLVMTYDTAQTKWYPSY